MHVPKHCPKVSKPRVISTQNRFEILNSVENIESAFDSVDKVAGNKLANTSVLCKQGVNRVSNSTVVKKTAVKSQKSNVINVVSTHDSSSDKTSQQVSKLDKCQNNCTGESNISKKSCESIDTAVHRTATTSQKGNATNVLSLNISNNDKTCQEVSEVNKCQNGGTGELNTSEKSLYDQNRQGNSHVHLETDKYDLELRFWPRHRQQIAAAANNSTFVSWNEQTQDKFGFIPLGDLTLPNIDLQKQSTENIFDIHRRIKVSGNHNYMGTQIQIQSQLKPDIWQKYLNNYWDSQLVLLLRYGFPLDFDYASPLKSVHQNHSSATDHTEDVKAYLTEEKDFGAMLGPFQEPPIGNLHISPFLTRDKPGGAHRRVIVDLSFPHGYSVNAGVQSDTYLGTPFLLTLPTIDNITNKVKQLGKGCHLYKIDLSRAFRHVKLDPKDYNLLGLRLNDL